MAERLTTYDPAEDLTTDEAVAIYMAEAFHTNDVAYIAHALGVVARAKGMAEIAGQTGLSREQLYRSFSAVYDTTTNTVTRLVFTPFGSSAGYFGPLAIVDDDDIDLDTENVDGPFWKAMQAALAPTTLYPVGSADNRGAIFLDARDDTQDRTTVPIEWSE